MEIKINNLDKKTAQQNIDRLVELESLIPKIDVNPAEIIAESKGDRVMYAKWKHSLYAQSQGKTVAFLIAYERKSEQNDQYPQNCLYINTIAVDEEFQGQGIGRMFINKVIKNFKVNGFLELEGESVIKVQTNKAQFNESVQKFYESFGFKKTGEKNYDNRTDNIYTLKL